MIFTSRRRWRRTTVSRREPLPRCPGNLNYDVIPPSTLPLRHLQPPSSRSTSTFPILRLASSIPRCKHTFLVYRSRFRSIFPFTCLSHPLSFSSNSSLSVHSFDSIAVSVSSPLLACSSLAGIYVVSPLLLNLNVGLWGYTGALYSFARFIYRFNHSSILICLQFENFIIPIVFFFIRLLSRSSFVQVLSLGFLYLCDGRCI